MKTYLTSRCAFALICAACSLATPATSGAQDTRTTDSDATRASRGAGTAQDHRATTDTENVRVTRASNFLGSDVLATDGRKVGDIVDYYIDLSAAPRVAYVVIMTGGFLNMGGDTRAVPASAITASGDNCRINIGSAQFWDVPVLPENRQRFLSDAQHQQRISQLFSQANATASSSATRDSSRKSATGATTASTRSGSGDDENRAGAPTGRTNGQRLVSFSELRNADAYGQQDARLGYFADAWINLNEDRVPYIEITPTFQPFRSSLDRRYAVPTAKLAQKRENFGYKVDVSTDDLSKAEPVSEAEGVRMLEEGRFGTTVLRVTVPER